MKIVFSVVRKILFLALLLSVFGCKKSPSQWLSNYELPLVNDTLSLADIGGEVNVNSNPSGYPSIQINRDLYTLNVEEIVGIPDTTIVSNFSIAFNFTAPAGYTLVNQIEENNLNLLPIELKEVRLKSGTFQFQLENPYETKVIFTIVLPDVIINGSVFQKVVPVEAGTLNNPTIKIQSFTLENAMIRLTGNSGSGSNLLRSQITVQSDPNGGSVSSTPQHQTRVRSTFKDVRLSYAKGFFGTQTETATVEEELNFFQGIVEGDFDLTSGMVQLVIENNAKVHGKVKIASIKGVGANGDTISLQSSEIGIWRNVNTATGAYGNFQPQSTSYPFHFNNSNLEAFLEARIKKIKVAYSYQINPYGNLSSSADEIFSPEMLKLKLVADFPLSIGLYNLVLSDTISFNASSVLKDDGRFQQLTLQCLGTNLFLFAADLDLLFLDENFQAVLEKKESFKIPSAINGIANNLNYPSKAFDSQITLNANEIKSLALAKYLLIKTKLNTPNAMGNNAPVTFQDHQFIHIQIRANGQYTLQVD